MRETKRIEKGAVPMNKKAAEENAVLRCKQIFAIFYLNALIDTGFIVCKITCIEQSH